MTDSGNHSEKILHNGQRYLSEPGSMQEQELIEALHGGSQAAFKTVYDRLYDPIYWFGMKYLGTEAEVEDILSESFLRVWTKRSEFASVQSIHMFLHVAVKNKCFDVLRRREMQAHKHAEILFSLESQQPEDFFVEQVQAELMRKIYEQVHQLPSHLREVFLLSYQEGLKPAQIAERLQLNVQTVKNRKVTALKVLKAALGHEPLVLALLVLMEMQLPVS
jgi:RNA polymerase sigma-70 factor (family 1)